MDADPKIRLVFHSVADPGCLSRIRLFSIPDPGSELSPSRIPDTHQIIYVFYLTQKNGF